VTHERVMWHGETEASVPLPTLIMLSSRGFLVNQVHMFRTRSSRYRSGRPHVPSRMGHQS
jgi:hypothetical protein